jgi:membrane-associated phospholipid phosphatase
VPAARQRSRAPDGEAAKLPQESVPPIEVTAQMKARFATLMLLLAVGPGLGRAAAAEADAGIAPPRTPTTPEPEPRPHLTVDLKLHSVATGSLLLLSGVSQLEARHLAASSCRWCEPPQVDRWVRQQLRWTDARAAKTLSSVLFVAIPAGSALTLGLAGRADGAGRREVVEDLLVVTEAASVAVLLTQTSKLAAARLRPDIWASGGHGTTDSRMSFWGGHSAFAFSVAAGATQVARLRGRPGWKWLGVASFAAAAATGWPRVAGDRHWATDVVVGAAVGTAAGLAVPLLAMRPADERGTAVTLIPSPGGLTLLF